MTSNRPRTVRVSIGTSDTRPCSSMRGPPMPVKRRSGSCGFRPAIRRAASMSPETSPATRARVVAVAGAGAVPPVLSAYDATGARAQEIEHGLDLAGAFAALGRFFGQLGLGFFQRLAA